jgi:hypothetical protein
VEGKSNFFESKELVKAVAAPPPNPWKMVAICSSFLYGWKSGDFQEDRMRKYVKGMQFINAGEKWEREGGGEEIEGLQKRKGE